MEGDKFFVRCLFASRDARTGLQNDNYHPKPCRQRKYSKGRSEQEAKMILQVLPMLVVPAEYWVLVVF